jgi:hypothetical protein
MSLRTRICKQLLTVAARFALRHSIRLRELVELLKQAMVDCALEESRESNSPVTTAKLSVMTGVHRKDVDRLINDSSDNPVAENSLIARIIGQWRSHSSFCDKVGRPKILSVEGAVNGFTDLVRSVTSELNPSLVLAELERVGAVTRHRLGIKLIVHVYVPKPHEMSYYAMLAEDTRELVACIEHNLSAQESQKSLHIKTEYDGIPDSLLLEVSEWMLREGSRVHKKFAEYLSAKDKDVNPELRHLKGRNRVSITSFCNSERADVVTKKIKKKGVVR